VVLLAAALSALFLVLYALGFEQIIQHARLRGGFIQRGTENFLLLAGVYVVHFLAVMLAIFVSVDALAGDIGSHTIQAMIAKPMRRWQLVAGKWLGSVAMVALYAAFMAGCILAITRVEAGYVPPNAWAAVVTPILEAAVLVSLALWIGVYASTMTTGVALFLLYGLAFVGAWIEQVGAITQSPGAIDVGIVSSLIMPVEALWRRTAFLLQPPNIGAVGFSPFTAFSVPSPAMVVYAAGYIVICFAMAVRSFARRDL
jgi:ABC-type transport system involved in multi-copper enzyme maturation permease subunit